MNFNCNIAWGQRFLGQKWRGAIDCVRELFIPFHVEWNQRCVGGISIAGS